jgi:hypothetical protein
MAHACRARVCGPRFAPCLGRFCGLCRGSRLGLLRRRGPPEYVEGYEPPFSDGYVVYYDEVGRPYYYENGAVVWIAPGSPAYARFAYHWRLYGPAYRRWYAHHGYRYRAYRARPR